MAYKIRREEPQTTIRTKGEYQGAIECSISASVLIDGDENWLSFRMNLPIKENETPQQASERITDEALGGFEQFVNASVQKIREMNQ